MIRLPVDADLSATQRQVVEQAAYRILVARKEALAMLARAGIGIPEDGFGFGNPCSARIEGHGGCPCHEYQGDGGPCLRSITVDAGASPPHSPCQHPASKHLPT